MRDILKPSGETSITGMVLLVAYILAWMIGYTVALLIGWPAQWVRDRYVRVRYHLIYRNDPGKAVLRLRALLQRNGRLNK